MQYIVATTSGKTGRESAAELGIQAARLGTRIAKGLNQTRTQGGRAKQMRTPSIHFADDLKGWSEQTEDKKNGRWVCARPMGHDGLCLSWRFRLAWRVFTGKADVLAWKAGQSEI